MCLAGRSFLQRVFGGNAAPALLDFVKESKLTDAELAEIRELLDAKLTSKNIKKKGSREWSNHFGMCLRVVLLWQLLPLGDRYRFWAWCSLLTDSSVGVSALAFNVECGCWWSVACALDNPKAKDKGTSMGTFYLVSAVVIPADAIPASATTHLEFVR